jgi:heme/copper-type cytochrome/quinol oxidase subunit 3
VTNAIITAVPAKKPKLKTPNAPTTKRRTAFWIYLMSDAIIFALLFAA